MHYCFLMQDRCVCSLEGGGQIIGNIILLSLTRHWIWSKLRATVSSKHMLMCLLLSFERYQHMHLKSHSRIARGTKSQRWFHTKKIPFSSHKALLLSLDVITSELDMGSGSRDWNRTREQRQDEHDPSTVLLWSLVHHCGVRKPVSIWCDHHLPHAVQHISFT